MKKNILNKQQIIKHAEIRFGVELFIYLFSILSVTVNSVSSNHFITNPISYIVSTVNIYFNIIQYITLHSIMSHDTSEKRGKKR